MAYVCVLASLTHRVVGTYVTVSLGLVKLCWTNYCALNLVSRVHIVAVLHDEYYVYLYITKGVYLWVIMESTMVDQRLPSDPAGLSYVFTQGFETHNQIIL